VNNRFRPSHSVYNCSATAARRLSCWFVVSQQLWSDSLIPSLTGGRVNVGTYFSLKPEYLPAGREDSDAPTESAMPSSNSIS